MRLNRDLVPEGFWIIDKSDVDWAGQTIKSIDDAASKSIGHGIGALSVRT